MPALDVADDHPLFREALRDAVPIARRLAVDPEAAMSPPEQD
jgi:hypothetical protein